MKHDSLHTIENVREVPLEQPRFVRPLKLEYDHNGVSKTWEAVKSHDSVAVLLYHVQKNAFLLVKQFRPPVYMNNPHDGFTYELCAGILDKAIDPLQTIKEEIDEECGYNVPLEAISRVTSFYTCVGFSGTNQTLYYAQIDESMKIHDGGGIHDENIELYMLSLKDAKQFALDEKYPKTPGLMFAFYWFFDRYPSESLSRN